MTKLPHLASKAAVGFAATVSSRDLPCFLSAATFSRIATSMSRNSLSSALLLTGFPCPGMMMVLSVVAARLQRKKIIVPILDALDLGKTLAGVFMSNDLCPDGT